MLFNEEKFKTDLKNYLIIRNISSYYVFLKKFLKVLGGHAPMKNKTIRANHEPCHKNYENNITDNRFFWKTVKPLLSDKGVNTTKI